MIFITASPKVGDKQVRLTYLTNWIERKLKEEFKVHWLILKLNAFSNLACQLACVKILLFLILEVELNFVYIFISPPLSLSVLTR